MLWIASGSGGKASKGSFGIISTSTNTVRVVTSSLFSSFSLPPSRDQNMVSKLNRSRLQGLWAVSTFNHLVTQRLASVPRARASRMEKRKNTRQLSPIHPLQLEHLRGLQGKKLLQAAHLIQFVWPGIYRQKAVVRSWSPSSDS